MIKAGTHSYLFALLIRNLLYGFYATDSFLIAFLIINVSKYTNTLTT